MMLISKFDTGDIEKRIEKFEHKHGIVFPEQYRVFMLRYNGGDTPKTTVTLNRKKYQLRALFGICSERYSFDTVSGLCRFILDGFLPVGTDYFGNYYAIGVDGENCGKIFFLDHEKGYAAREICDSFNRFVSAAKSEKIGHIPTIEERRQQLIANGFGHLITSEKLEGWQAEIDRYEGIVQETVII